MTNPLRALLKDMQDFARTAPSGQQTRQKTAREMVGFFADELEAALAAEPPEEKP